MFPLNGGPPRSYSPVSLSLSLYSRNQLSTLSPSHSFRYFVLNENALVLRRCALYSLVMRWYRVSSGPSSNGTLLNQAKIRLVRLGVDACLPSTFISTRNSLCSRSKRDSLNCNSTFTANVPPNTHLLTVYRAFGWLLSRDPHDTPQGLPATFHSVQHLSLMQASIHPTHGPSISKVARLPRPPSQRRALGNSSQNPTL